MRVLRRQTVKVVAAPSSEDPQLVAYFNIRQDGGGWCEIDETTPVSHRLWPLLYRSVHDAEEAILTCAEHAGVVD